MKNHTINSIGHYIMKYLLFILTLLFSSIIVAEELTGNEIAFKSEEKYNGDTQISDSTMILIDPNGSHG